MDSETAAKAANGAALSTLEAERDKLLQDLKAVRSHTEEGVREGAELNMLWAQEPMLSLLA